MEYWKQSLLPLKDAGQLPATLPHAQIARMMVINFVGALDLWVQLELDDEQFRAQVLYGVSVLLLSVANADQRDHLNARLRVLERQLPKRFSSQGVEAVESVVTPISDKPRRKLVRVVA